jgi:putative ABC transport system substrate-binding protein
MPSDYKAILRAGTESSIDAAFGSLVERRLGALLVAGDPLFYGQRDQPVALTARSTVPTAYFLRDFVRGRRNPG